MSPTGNDGNSGASQSAPLKTIQKAVDSAKSGDSVYLMSGEFTTDGANIVHVTKDGITVTNAPGAQPVLRTSPKNWNAVRIDADHVQIHGLRVEGHRDQITLAFALSQQQETKKPAANTNCISFVQAHHIVISDNVCNALPGGGIGGTAGDYITIERNVVSGTSWYTTYGTSGISFLRSWNSDRSTGVKLIVRQNVVYGNQQKVPTYWNNKITDGGGIIVDSHQKSTDAAGKPDPYLGRTLIENNVSFGNGGLGVNVFKSDHVDVIHNTTSGNSLSPEIGDRDIAVVGADDVFVAGNVAVRNDGRGIDAGGSTRVTLVNNMTTGDPKFRNAADRDFRPSPGSPAVDGASSGRSPAVDLRGTKRPQGKAADLGAYEVG